MAQGFLRNVLSVGFVAVLLSLSAASADDSARIQVLKQLIQDPSPKVRVEALRSLAKIHTPEAAALALSVLDRPMDPTLDYALWLTINDLSDPWIQSLRDGSWKTEGHEKQLEFALKSIRPEQASQVLGQLIGGKPLPADGSGPWIELIGSAGTPKELRALYDQVLGGGFQDAAAARALDALSAANRIRKVRPGGTLSDLNRLLDSPSAAVQVSVLRLVAEWKDSGSVARVATLAGAGTTPPEVREAAFNTLRSVGGSGSLEALSLLASSKDPAIQRKAAAGLAALDLGKSIPVLVTLVRSPMPEADAVAFWRSILPAKGAGKAVASALPESGINPEVARAGMRVAREGGRSDLDLVVALARGAGLATDSTAASAEVIREIAAKAQAQGDPARGERIYRRNDLACLSCHSIGGAGGRVGPDLTSIGASAPADYLVESLLLPNAKIKEGFHSILVTSKDGTEFTGTLARETPEEVVLRTAAGTEQSIPKNDIAKREQGTLSLMPGGLLDPLNEQEQLDLVAFLSRLGKPGDYDAARGGVARRWRVAQTVHTDAQAGRELWPLDASWEDKRWKPTYSLVNGSVPKSLIDEITQAEVWSGRLGVYLATEVTASRAGPAEFSLGAGDGAELWIDGRKVGGPGSSRVDLTPGTHRVLVRLDPKRVPPAVRLESADVAFSLN
ncbi:MAG: c-type cytochrome [Verrucomicrobiales bacterium]|nr:c-type cytochrome [Verrucomicrobiales bacterium]